MSGRLRFALVLAVLTAIAACVPPALAGNAVRTLVVRGLVARADGKPAAGARVSAKGPKGGVNVSATTDERGRFSLQMPMGSPTGIRAAAFAVEVRAEAGGKKLLFASGSPALGITVDFVPGTNRLRVRSNSPAATAAVITAFVQDGAPTAWVDADFGGAVRATGRMALGAEDEITIAGVAPAPGNAAAEPERVKPLPVRTPAPINI
ncbi:MAG: carboxypeptidase regulatory-like domain-containing protein [Candidatus Eisenbacteria bacterium]|uniref:Carboxypeptidase regulatory-like domain-containing protein n=1 Tax=Eiseniibacteriota bacterium TaxID=2212470 RepID=A0A933SC18_UNCEI|nr:carboxypeptidase regulatory-like domain-containing protein [Candidatus Eisenbacteria bacterium]